MLLMAREENGTQAIDRAARILEHLVERDDFVTLSSVVEGTQLPKSSRSTRCSRMRAARSIACVPFSSRAISTMMWHQVASCQPGSRRHAVRRGAAMRDQG